MAVGAVKKLESTGKVAVETLAFFARALSHITELEIFTI